MIKRGTANSVLVELEKLSDDEYVFSSGAKIFMNNTFKPENFVRIFGECVAVPEILTKGDQIKYEEGDYRFVDSIEPEVKVGDRVYFTYISLHKGNLLEFEGKSYCNIPYSAILCVVRDVRGFNLDIDRGMKYCEDNNITLGKLVEEAQDGKLTGDMITYKPSTKEIIPIGGNILCEEYYGKDAEMIEVNGFKIHINKSKSSTLITDIIKKPSEKQATVRIVGKPLKGDEMEVVPGEIVTFPEKFGFKNNIEGMDYLFLKYWDIHGVLEEA